MSNQTPQAPKDPFADVSGLAQKANDTPNLITDTDASTLSQLVKLLLMKEGREVEKMEGDRKQREARQKQHDRNAADTDSKYLLKQARCKHRKGGKNPSKTMPPNYAVYQFTFMRAETVIRCAVCGMRWRSQDTDEFLVRSGKKISNHTKIGWRRACEMMEQSSNTPASSEIPGRVVVNGIGGLATNDATGVVVGVRPVDEHGHEVGNVEL